MSLKLFDSELKVMEFIWDNEPVSAKDLSLLAAKETGWNKNTTYTVIKKLESKGYIKRNDPGFIWTKSAGRKPRALLTGFSAVRKGLYFPLF